MSTTYFTEDHEWIRVEGDTATVGITNHAQEQLGDLVFLELPEIDREVSKGEDAVVVESVKAASDVYSPVAGKIVEVNESVTADPALVNRDAEGEGWLFKVALSNKDELDELMNQEAYQALIG